jgi:hypothetical protein
MPTAPIWIGARLAAVGIAEGLGTSMTLLYGRVGAATQLACSQRRPREVTGLYPVFLAWDFVEKKPSEIKI